MWYEELKQLLLSGLGVVIAGLLWGVWWVIRTFFTDHGRINKLEESLKSSREEHLAHREEIKDALKIWHEEVRHDFDNVNKTLMSIQEFLRK